MAETELSTLYLVSYEMDHPEDRLYEDFFQILRKEAVELIPAKVWILRSEESTDTLFARLSSVCPAGLQGGPLLVVVVDSIERGSFRARALDAQIERTKAL